MCPSPSASFDEDRERGFCLVSALDEGVNPIFSDEGISRLFAVPAVFPEVVGYFEASRLVSSDTVSPLGTLCMAKCQYFIFSFPSHLLQLLRTRLLYLTYSCFHSNQLVDHM